MWSRIQILEPNFTQICSYGSGRIQIRIRSIVSNHLWLLHRLLLGGTQLAFCSIRASTFISLCNMYSSWPRGLVYISSGVVCSPPPPTLPTPVCLFDKQGLRTKPQIEDRSSSKRCFKQLSGSSFRHNF